MIWLVSQPDVEVPVAVDLERVAKLVVEPSGERWRVAAYVDGFPNPAVLAYVESPEAGREFVLGMMEGIVKIADADAT